jgi:hypothetical protein
MKKFKWMDFNSINSKFHYLDEANLKNKKKCGTIVAISMIVMIVAMN